MDSEDKSQFFFSCAVLLVRKALQTDYSLHLHLCKPMLIKLHFLVIPWKCCSFLWAATNAYQQKIICPEILRRILMILPSVCEHQWRKSQSVLTVSSTALAAVSSNFGRYIEIWSKMEHIHMVVFQRNTYILWNSLFPLACVLENSPRKWIQIIQIFKMSLDILCL